MRDTKFLLRASELRARAEKILAKAETYSDADAQEIMREVAANYMKMALRLEQSSLYADKL